MACEWPASGGRERERETERVKERERERERKIEAVHDAVMTGDGPPRHAAHKRSRLWT